MKPIRTGWGIWPPVLILRYWLIQGTLYMNWIERLHRWTVELVLFIGAYVGFSPLVGYPANLIGCIALAHTLSALLNGHLFAMCAHDLFWFSLYKDRQKFLCYIEKVGSRLHHKAPNYVAGVVFFGSLARGVFRDTSDLDIRFIPTNGFWNAFLTVHLVFVERLHALLAGFPIDVYMFRTESEIREKMDVNNEAPVCVYRYGTKLEKILPETKSFESFREIFLRHTNEDYG